MAEVEARQWTIVLVLTALSLSLVVLAQVVTRYTAAYMAAPREAVTFVDAVDFSIQENESYDRDVARVSRLEDKIRLGRLLREIQKGGDDLREELNGLLVAEDTTTLRTAARVLWASRRVALEERVRRLDLLRMRFLVVYMGIVAGNVGNTKPHHSPKDPEKTPHRRQPDWADLPAKPVLQKALTDSIHAKPPLRRLATQSIGHHAPVAGAHRQGWAGVMQELQKSPKLHERHASIERAMSRTPSP